MGAGNAHLDLRSATLQYEDGGGGFLSYSDVSFTAQAFAIAASTSIENAIGADRADWLMGNAGRNTLNGNAGTDTLFGGAGKDKLFGGVGDDTLNGGNHRDTLKGGTGRDTLNGNAGNDILKGNRDSDTLDGGKGNDVITGGKGDDIMSGSGGADDFIFLSGFGNDIITDFNAFNNKEDIDLSGVTQIKSWNDLSNNHMEQIGLDVVIRQGANTVTLEDVDIGDLGQGDFLF